MPNFYPSQFATNKFYKVPEATEILAQWGISKNEKKTRDLIAKGKLIASKAGDDPDDRRSGYLIAEKAIYDLIVLEIPIAKEVLETMRTTMPKGKASKKAKDAKVAIEVPAVDQGNEG